MGKIIYVIFELFAGIFYLLSSCAGFAGIILILVINEDSISGIERIWKYSKMKTIKKLLEKNNFETYPILYFDSNNNASLYKYNYQTLLANSSKQCQKAYKKCGILDTMGNIMCIPEEDICPINEVKIDLESKYISYTQQGYNYTYIQNLTDGYVLYYKNNETNNSIITDIKYSQEIPTYINIENFVLDQSSYDSYEEPDDDYDYDNYEYYMKNKSILFQRKKDRKRKALRKLELNISDLEVYDYLKEKMKGDWNIDKSYQNIGKNIYKGNYIGFQDSSNMQQYNDLDLFGFDSNRFPNVCAYIFGWIVLFIIVFTAGIAQCPISIGYLSYTLHEDSNNNLYEIIDKIMNIKADLFLKNYLAEFVERKPSHDNIIALVALFSSGIGLTVLGILFIYLTEFDFDSKEIESTSNEEQKENLMK